MYYSSQPLDNCQVCVCTSSRRICSDLHDLQCWIRRWRSWLNLKSWLFHWCYMWSACGRLTAINVRIIDFIVIIHWRHMQFWMIHFDYWLIRISLHFVCLADSHRIILTTGSRICFNKSSLCYVQYPTWTPGQSYAYATPNGWRLTRSFRMIFWIRNGAFDFDVWNGQVYGSIGYRCSLGQV